MRERAGHLSQAALIRAVVASQRLVVQGLGRRLVGPGRGLHPEAAVAHLMLVQHAIHPAVVCPHQGLVEVSIRTVTLKRIRFCQLVCESWFVKAPTPLQNSDIHEIQPDKQYGT